MYRYLRHDCIPKRVAHVNIVCDQSCGMLCNARLGFCCGRWDQKGTEEKWGDSLQYYYLKRGIRKGDFIFENTGETIHTENEQSYTNSHTNDTGQRGRYEQHARHQFFENHACRKVKSFLTFDPPSQVLVTTSFSLPISTTGSNITIHNGRS